MKPKVFVLGVALLVSATVGLLATSVRGAETADTPSAMGLGLSHSSAIGAPAPDGSTPPALGFGVPLAFIENRGQWAAARRLIARGGRMAATLERDAVVLQLLGEKRTVVRLAFAGASPAAMVVGEEPLRAVYNFFTGGDPARWRTEVRAYKEVVYRGIWEGIDLRVHEEAGQLKYDVMVAPGADLERVVVRAEGFAGIAVEADGSLTAQLPAGGAIRQPPPVTWERTTAGARRPVACSYRRIDATSYGFNAPDRDPGLPLVIDPGLEWSTFLGGVGDDWAWTVARAETGEVVVAGQTAALDFPTTPGVYEPAFSGMLDGFVSCFDPDQIGAAQLVWSTYLGGAAEDRILALRLAGGDPGAVVITGTTASIDFPATPQAYDPTFNGHIDAFVTRLGGAGSTLVYSTFLGEISLEVGEALHVNAAGEVTVGGMTGSFAFPTTAGAYDTSYNGSGDAFVTRLSASGESIIFSTFLGGTGLESFYRPETYDIRFLGLDVDENNETLVAGRTASSNFPVTLGAYDTSFNGGSDGFVTRLNADGSGLVWSTFLGGSSEDGAICMTLGPTGSATVGVYTYSANMPTTPGAFDPTINNAAGINDGYVALLDAAGGSQLLYGTYLGGSFYDAPFALAASEPILGDVVVTGFCGQDFPISEGAYDPTFGGFFDGYVVRLSPDGNGLNDLVYSTYIGGTGDERSLGLALDDEAGRGLFTRAILAGQTASDDFPTTPGAYQTTPAGPPGAREAFACRIGPLWPVDPTTAVPESPHDAGSPAAIRIVNLEPNPVREALFFQVAARSEARVRLGIYDMQGRLVARLHDRRMVPGTHDFTWTPEATTPRGTYVLRLDSNGKIDAKKFALTR